MRVEVTWTYESQDQSDDLHTLALRSCALAAGRTESQGAKFRTDCQEVQDMGEFVAMYVVGSAYTGCGNFHYRRRRSSMLAIYARRSSKKLGAYAPARPLRAREAGQDPCIAKRRLHLAIPHVAWPACTRRYKASPLLWPLLFTFIGKLRAVPRKEEHRKQYTVFPGAALKRDFTQVSSAQTVPRLANRNTQWKCKSDLPVRQQRRFCLGCHVRITK